MMMISVRFSGYIIKKLDRTRAIVTIGFVISAVSYIVSGPMYPIDLEPNLYYASARQILYGIAMGPQTVGAFTAGMGETAAYGFPKTVSTSSAYSSLYQTFTAIGYAGHGSGEKANG